MKPGHCIAPALVVGLLAHETDAQSFNFSNFSSTSGLSLRGSALQIGNRLRLTTNIPNQTAGVWANVRQDVRSGFDTEFEFSITPGTVLADGLCFVVHGAPSGPSTLGGSVWGLGYGAGANNTPIPNSIAIEIDTFQDGFNNDTSSNELSIHTRGIAPNDENELASIGRTTPTFSLSTGALHKVRILYVPGLLEVFIDNLVVPLLSVPYDLTLGGTHLTGAPVGGLDLPGGDAWVGFGATTGANNATEEAILYSWSWASLANVHPCYAGSIAAAGGSGAFDVLRVNGLTGGFSRTVEVASFDPFSFDLAAPPNHGSANFALFGQLGIADGSAALSFPMIGQFCFPPIVPLVFPVGPAPASIPIPPGLPLLGGLTMQALIQDDSSNSASFAVSNAVALRFVVPPLPAISSVAPRSSSGPQVVTVSGTGFSPAATVSAGAMLINPIAVTRQEIRFLYPVGVACDTVLTVSNPDGQVATQVLNPTPTIVSPPTSGSGATGSVIVLQGTSFLDGTVVSVGGVPAVVLNRSDQTIIVQVPPGPLGAATVVVTTPGGCSATTTHTYI